MCKSGYSGQKCQMCPDQTNADETSCASSKETGDHVDNSYATIGPLIFPGTTKYLNPIRCGGGLCDFGSTCSQQESCVCEIDCLKYGKLQQPVCGSDGNTYRSECQLRQYSCRIQKEIIIVSRSPCKGKHLQPKDNIVLYNPYIYYLPLDFHYIFP